MRAAPIIFDDCCAILDDLAGRLDAMAGTSLLVTGANGFLMSYLVDVVAAWNDLGRGAPVRIVALDNNATGRRERLEHLAARPDLCLVEHDITRPLAFDEPVDWIVHGASIASPSAYRRFPLETIDANVIGTRHMLELGRAHGVRGMLVMSTSEVYGDPDPAFIPTPEAYPGNVSCTGPRACYDESKRLGETLCSIYHRQFGTPIKAVRPFNVYGPGQRLDDGRLLPDLMGAALRREPFTLLSDGMATRAFCYVADEVRGMFEVLIAGQDGEAYNVGNDKTEVTIRDLAATLRDVAGPPPIEIRFAKSPDPDYLTDNPQRRCPDITKLRTQTGFEPQVDIKTGLERTLRSYRELEGGQ